MPLLLFIFWRDIFDDAKRERFSNAVWGIRLVTHNDTVRGNRLAQTTAKQLQAHELEEVTVQPIPSQGAIVVMLGAWLTDPRKNEAARAVLAHVKKLRRDGKKAFPDAMFWSIER